MPDLKKDSLISPAAVNIGRNTFSNDENWEEDQEAYAKRQKLELASVLFATQLLDLDSKGSS